MVIKRFASILGSRRLGTFTMAFEKAFGSTNPSLGSDSDTLPEGDSPEANTGRGVVCILMEFGCSWELTNTCRGCFVSLVAQTMR